MMIYLIVKDAASPIPSGLSSINFETLKLEGIQSNLKIQDDFMKNIYGFNLSETEIKMFNAHVQIYQHFLASGQPYCLILENIKSLNKGLYEIEEKLRELPEDWEVFFPFDRSDHTDQYCKKFYILGNRWGTDAYFINRKGAKKMTSIDRIRQPVDEEILDLMGKEELSVYYEETDFFEYETDYNYYLDRQKTIETAISGFKAWNKHDKELLKTILNVLSVISSREQLQLILTDGSLLGQIRHGRIMDWDDDVDMGINEDKLPLLLDALNNYTDLAYGKFYWSESQHLHVKVWNRQGVTIPRYEYKFPFVDIWIYKDEEEAIVFNHGITYPKNIFYPLQNIRFETIDFHIPNLPLACLDLTYTDWRKSISIYTWSHKEEMPVFPPLTMDIATDENGRLVTK